MNVSRRKLLQMGSIGIGASVGFASTGARSALAAEASGGTSQVTIEADGGTVSTLELHSDDLSVDLEWKGIEDTNEPVEFGLLVRETTGSADSFAPVDGSTESWDIVLGGSSGSGPVGSSGDASWDGDPPATDASPLGLLGGDPFPDGYFTAEDSPYELEFKMTFEHSNVEAAVATATVDVEVVDSGIPANGLYLDDWADSALSGRAAYSETALSPESLEPESSAFGSPTRPEWTQEIGNGVSVSSGSLGLSGSTDYVMHTPLNVGGSSWDTPMTWEFTVQHNGTSNGNDRYAIALEDTAYTASDNGNNDTYFTGAGYALSLNDAGSKHVRFGRGMAGDWSGLDTTLITGSTFGSGTEVTFRITRDASGEWELFQDGVSQGNATDVTVTNIGYMGISGDSRAAVTVDDWRVF